MSVHPHQREGATGRRELSLALGITLSFMLIEVVAALISRSLALLADAGHMLTDAIALTLSLFAAWITAKPATAEKTYGYYRTEILAALINGVLLWLMVGWIYVRAVQRLAAPPEILTGPMLIAAAFGLVANVISGRILWRAGSRNLNVQAARLHVLGDALGSCGVIVAGLCIALKGWRIADPLASMFIGLLIAVSSWALIARSVNVLLEATPAHVDQARLLAAMRRVKGVHDVHDLHVWTITTGLEAMSGHVLVHDLAQGPRIIEELNKTLGDEFGVTHTTFQLEPAHSFDGTHADSHEH